MNMAAEVQAKHRTSQREKKWFVLTEEVSKATYTAKEKQIGME